MPQLELTDCGAACLAMSLARIGLAVSLRELRDVMGVGRDGLDAGVIVDTARRLGAEARGVAVDVADIRHLPPGTILHWEFNHFVVLEQVRRGRAVILDPRNGRRHVSYMQLGKSFTGVALLIEPGTDLRRSPRVRGHAWRHLAPALRQRALLAQIAVTSLLVQVLGLAFPLLIGSVVDRVVPGRDAALLAILCAGLAVMVVYQLFASFVRAHLLLHLRTYLDLAVTRGFIGHLVDLPYAYFLRRSAGDLMARVNSNAMVREILTSRAISTLLDGALASLYLGLLFAKSPPMGALVLGIALLQLGILVISKGAVARLASESFEAQARAQSYLVQLLAGIQTLKATGSEREAVERWTALFIDETNLVLARGRLTALIDAASGTLRLAAPLAVLSFGATRVLSGDLTLGAMLALSALASGFLVPLSALVGVGQLVPILRSYMARIDDVLDEPAEASSSAIPAPPVLGQVSVRDVTFSYSPRSTEVLKDITLEIPQGALCAIVGVSGSGKSTLASLIGALYAPSSGNVLIDGADVRLWEPRTFRRQIGFVPQDTYLFGTSIRENIALGCPGARLSEVEGAAIQAEIHEEIMAMPLGYDSILADGGASLSGGQRQRIALARALLARPAILILDEATSHLDVETEAKVYENLARLTCTRVVITHRLSTIAAANPIIVLDEGEVVEMGSHDALLNAAGLYASLVAAATVPLARREDTGGA